ncbi:MAG: DUF3656 domain-containing protein [Bacilli bacterium]
MKKVELLSPAGDFSSLKQAIHNGADAIYLGGKNFGARAFANNFSNEELEYAIKYAHLYDVKIYVTVNTLIYEEETNDFFKYIDFLVSIKVDALIMQDLGMIKTVKEMYPDITIHASTQFHNYNNDTLEVLKDLGVKRVVLARELSIDEINNMSCNIEKEVFIHGALCVSYSGECLFSSLVANRSGNRGECAGSCRLPYDLMKDDEILKLKDKYLLSTRELNTTLNIKELLDSNITSLKIEGRMKTPAYVGFVTKTYRHLIDNYYNNLNCVISKEDTIKLTKLYNREFTNGYLFNTKELMNINTPNHLGIKLGEVLDINSKYIKIKLIDELHQGDGIRFFNTDIGMITNFIYNEKELLINHAKSGDIILLDNKDNLNIKTTVLKTYDILLNKELENYELKKINIDIIVKAHLNQELYISFSDNTNTVSELGSIIKPSLTSPITKDSITKQLSKLNSTLFMVNNISIQMDENIFISVKELNNIRRLLVSKLISLRENKGIVLVKKDINNKQIITNPQLELSVLVKNKEQLEACLNKVDNIYITNYPLYLEYKNKYKNIYYKIKRLNNEEFSFNNDKLLISDISGVKYNKDNYLVSDYYLNITNSYSLQTLYEMSVNKVTLSVELSNISLNNLIKEYVNRYKNLPSVEIIIYGRLELMLMKYCPLNLILNKENSCHVCKGPHKYYLVDKLLKKYPIVNDNCITHIFNYRNIDKFDSLLYYKKIGINSFRIELFDEDEKEVKELIDRFKNILFKF